MKRKYIVLMAYMIVQIASTSMAVEAQQEMQQYNIKCPASKLLPLLDNSYHECSNGFADGSCETFVELYRKLLPKYDCQRLIDSTSSKRYIVPAIWLANIGAQEDYIRLLWRLSNRKEKMFLKKPFAGATKMARELFGSKEFRDTLDGYIAEEYEDRSLEIERQLLIKR